MSGKDLSERLKRGWTTGACATAAAAAGFEALLTGVFPDPVTITLPGGLTPKFRLAQKRLWQGGACASVIKDAGDDPDVTHGAEIVAELKPLPPGCGLVFRAGQGVGTVTRPGLPLAVGEAAINPKPRAQIHANLQVLAERHGAALDLEITLCVPGGEAIAAKTWNPRLGIVGGISILGTTGVVIPYSCAAWIHSIHRGIDVARASGLTHVAGATGKTSEATVQQRYDLCPQQLIDMGDFAGGMLKYLRRHPIDKVTIAGGFAKLVKLGQGALDLHSSRSRVDFGRLAQWSTEAGGSRDLSTRITHANTAKQALSLSEEAGVALAPLVAKRAREVARATVDGAGEIEVLVIDRNGRVIGHAP